MSPLRLPLSFRGPFAAALRAVRDEPAPFALVGSWAGGGAVIGAAPARVVSGPAALAVLSAPSSPASLDDAFIGGGWFGFLGYGLGAEIEVLPPPPPRPAPLPTARLGWYEWVLRQDSGDAWWFEALADTPAARALADDLAARLVAGPAPRAWSLSTMSLAGAGADGHRAAVAECVERIAAGELFQANVCLRLDGRFAGSAADAFADAAARLQPAYGAFVDLGGGDALLSFSPELFLVRRGRVVETAPIKGTAPRSADDPAAAARARDALAASAKDAAEHVMIVDLMRNDLGRVAEYGSVRAEAEPEVQAHPGLWHLVTKVRATLRDDVTDAALLRATFPPGSVTGAPKVQALKVIDELEGTAREAYTGAIGMVSPHAGLELNVAIRTLEVAGDGRAWFGAGGGIVADSVPDAELAEALGKARPVLAALGASVPSPPPAAVRVPVVPRLARPDAAGGLLETLLVVDGVAVDAPAHLARLAASARVLYASALPDDLTARVEAAAANAGEGAHRLRVVLLPTGAAEVTVHAASLEPPRALTLKPVLLAGGAGAHKWADRTPFPDPAALICDVDGAVLEVASANVWALVDGLLLTPPADGRILPGVTRARALALGDLDGTPLAVGPLSLARCASAEALLVTSAIRRAAPAGLGGAAPTLLARELADALRTALLAPACSRA